MGMGFTQVWCGGVSRHTCGLTYSEVFLNHSSRWLCICRLSYILSFFYIPCVTEFLTFYFTGLELQIDYDDIPEYPWIHSTHQSCKFVTHHRPSRFSSRFSLSSQRAGFWVWFYFPFSESFCLFSVLFYKIQDFDTFSFSRLVNIQLDRLIMWMVELHIYFWECSALVAGPSRVM